jgi:hypothetical protein
MSINTPPAYVYISPGLLDNMRRETRRFLLHSYTRVARLSAGALDSWGQATYNFAGPVNNIPCFYAVKEVPIVTPEGLTTLNLPVLTLGFDDPAQVGDLVQNIQTTDGVLLVLGPVLIESLQPRDPNVGGPVLIEAHLREVEFVPTSMPQ